MLNHVRNGISVIREVKRIGKKNHWDNLHSRHVARMTLMCGFVEGGMLNYANANVKGSMSLPHDAVGYDHDSVGICQQRVGYDGSGSGGWGSLRHCQRPQGAAQSFVDRLISKGLDRTVSSAYRMGVAVQEVQVSAFPDRYEGEYDHAGRFLARWWRVTPAYRRSLAQKGIH